MPLVRFTVYTFLGSYPFCWGLAWVGYKMGEHWHNLESIFRKFDILIGAILVASAVWWVRRHLKAEKTGPGVQR